MMKKKLQQHWNRRRWWWKKKRTKEEEKKEQEEEKVGRGGEFFWNLRERWASEKKRKPTLMFGLVQVKWFGFISKQPNQLHPQLVHWWCWVTAAWNWSPKTVSCPRTIHPLLSAHSSLRQHIRDSLVRRKNCWRKVRKLWNVRLGVSRPSRNDSAL
jgi:hypothetical protein